MDRETKNLLCAAPFFRGLPAETVETLLSHGVRTRRCVRGETVLRAGDEVELTIIRNDTERTITVKLDPADENSPNNQH